MSKRILQRALLFSVLGFFGCGVKGPPLPPLETLPKEKPAIQKSKNGEKDTDKKKHKND
ncbi:MAG: hypothetical protein HY390_01685 [Deltaproteobacteria bacterium]|nr:hypothetical protein [Deltaproteobacteria bacterium]